MYDTYIPISANCSHYMYVVSTEYYTEPSVCTQEMEPKPTSTSPASLCFFLQVVECLERTVQFSPMKNPLGRACCELKVEDVFSSSHRGYETFTLVFVPPSSCSVRFSPRPPPLLLHCFCWMDGCLAQCSGLME